MSGMAGSQQGWVEAPYCPCPAGFEDMARQLAWVEPRPHRHRARPALRTRRRARRDARRGNAGVRRAATCSAARGVSCCPARTASGCESRTAASRLFDLHDRRVLRLVAPAFDPGPNAARDDGALDEEAFAAACASRIEAGSLLHSAFSVRTLSLFDRLPRARAAELSVGPRDRRGAACQSARPDAPIVVIGASADRALRAGLALRGSGAQPRVRSHVARPVGDRTNTGALMNAQASSRRRSRRLPLVAILRGLLPQEAMAIGEALVAGGWR